MTIIEIPKVERDLTTNKFIVTWWDRMYRCHQEVGNWNEGWISLIATINRAGGRLVMDDVHKGVSHLEFENERDATLFLLRWQ